MKLTEQQVRQVAELANLALSDAEIAQDDARSRRHS